MQYTRKGISTLKADLADNNHKFASAIARVGKHSEALRKMEKKLDLQYMRTVAEDLDKYLAAVQRRHQQISQLAEQRIRDDAEAKRRQEENHRQEMIKAEAEMQARLEAENKRAEEALESQRERAAKQAAEKKLVAEISKKVAAVTVRTRDDGAEKAASSGAFLKSAESALKLEERRSEIYNQVVTETEALLRNVDFRSHEMQIARRIRQISGTTESVRGKATELFTLITNSTNPLSQCVNPSGSFIKSVFAYAQVIVLLTSQLPQTMDFLLAELNRVCIYTVPKYSLRS